MKEITSVRYFLLLSEEVREKQIASIISSIGLLPKKLELIKDQSEQEKRKVVEDARFRIIGIPFTCIEKMCNPHNEEEMLVIGRLEICTVEQSVKFLSLFEEKQVRNKDSYSILPVDELKEFKNVHQKLFLKPKDLETVLSAENEVVLETA